MPPAHFLHHKQENTTMENNLHPINETCNYTPEALEKLPTLFTGHAEDLKVETESMRVWLCRVENKVTVEVLDSDGWNWRILHG